MTYETSGHGQDATAEVSRHREEDVHEEPQPPQQHGHEGEKLGSNTNPVKELYTESHITSELLNAASDRPLWSSEDTVVNVPDDYDTIQAAIDDCPVFLNHNYKIGVEPGIYDEDLFVRPIIAGQDAEIGTGTDFNADGTLEILGGAGSTEDASDYEVNSIAFASVLGQSAAQINSFTFTGTTPIENENTATLALSCDYVALRNCRFEQGSAWSSVAYRSYLDLHNPEFVNAQWGVRGKQMSNIACGVPTGSTDETGYRADSGTQIWVNEDGGSRIGSIRSTPDNIGQVYVNGGNGFYPTNVHGHGHQLKDLSSWEPEDYNIVALDDSTNTSTGEPELCIYRPDGWHEIGSSNIINTS